MRSMKRLVLSTTIIIVFFAAGVMADWYPEDGHKMHFPQLPAEYGWAVYASPTEMLADDWECSGTGDITDIHFWGSWKGGVTGELIGFHLYIYSDIPANPPDVPYSRPGQILWEYEVPIGMVVVRPISSVSAHGWFHPNVNEILPEDYNDYFQYNVFLPDEMYFRQFQGEVYWLGIYPILADPQNTFWGWNSSYSHWNDDAVYPSLDGGEWQELLTPPYGGVFYDYVPGDVNDDGVVDGYDPIYLQNWFMGIGEPPPFQINGFYAAADATGDCQVNTGDATSLMNYIQNGIPEPQCCDGYPSILCAESMNLAFVINGEEIICDCRPGDANGDGQVNVGDAVYLIGYIFRYGAAPTPYQLCSGDANCDCEVNVGDPLYIISIVYKFGDPPCNCTGWLETCGEPLRK